MLSVVKLLSHTTAAGFLFLERKLCRSMSSRCKPLTLKPFLPSYGIGRIYRRILPQTHNELLKIPPKTLIKLVLQELRITVATRPLFSPQPRNSQQRNRKNDTQSWLQLAWDSLVKRCSTLTDRDVLRVLEAMYYAQQFPLHEDLLHALAKHTVTLLTHTAPQTLVRLTFSFSRLEFDCPPLYAALSSTFLSHPPVYNSSLLSVMSVAFGKLRLCDSNLFERIGNLSAPQIAYFSCSELIHLLLGFSLVGYHHPALLDVATRQLPDHMGDMTAQELVLTAFFLTKLVSFTPQLFTQLEQWLFNASESISSQLSLGRKSTRRFSRVRRNALDDLRLTTPLFCSDGDFFSSGNAASITAPARCDSERLSPPAYEKSQPRIMSLSARQLVDLATSTAAMGFPSFKLLCHYQKHTQMEILSLPLLCRFGMALARMETLATLEARFVPNLSFWISFRSILATKLVDAFQYPVSKRFSTLPLDGFLDILDTAGHICAYSEALPVVDPNWNTLVLYPILYMCLSFLNYEEFHNYTLPQFTRSFKALRVLTPYVCEESDFATDLPQVSFSQLSRHVKTIRRLQTTLLPPPRLVLDTTPPTLNDSPEYSSELRRLLSNFTVSLTKSFRKQSICLPKPSTKAAGDAAAAERLTQCISIAYSLGTLGVQLVRNRRFRDQRHGGLLANVRKSMQFAVNLLTPYLAALIARHVDVIGNVQWLQLEVVASYTKHPPLPVSSCTATFCSSLIPPPSTLLSRSLSCLLEKLNVHHTAHHCIQHITFVPAVCYVKERSVAIVWCGSHKESPTHQCVGLKRIEVEYLRRRNYDVLVISPSWWSATTQTQKLETLRQHLFAAVHFPDGNQITAFTAAVAYYPQLSSNHYFLALPSGLSSSQLNQDNSGKALTANAAAVF